MSKTNPLAAPVALSLSLSALIGARALATDWPQFRGPFFNGSTDEKGLPARFDPAADAAWTAPLPGPSAATPVVFGDRVFLSSTDPDAGTLLAISLDRRSGKKLWQHEVARGLNRDSRSNFASNSPATDGERVFFFYGSGELVAFDVAGKQLWKRDLTEDYGEFAFLWTFSSSPLLYGGKLYIQVLQRDTAVDGRGFEDRANDSYLLALDPATGKQLWRVVRPSRARAESREAFTTPVPCRVGGREQILVVGGDALTGHDAASGRELWRWGTWNPERITHWRLVPSPAVGDGIALVCAPKRDPIYAIRLGGEGRLGDSAVAWVSRENRELSADVPTPAFSGGDFFVLSDVRKALLRVEPRTGKVRWSVRTPGTWKYEASPTVADGKVYLVNFRGEVVVVDAEKGEVLHTAAFEPSAEYPIRSTIVASHGQLFVRLNRKLVCIGGK